MMNSTSLVNQPIDSTALPKIGVVTLPGSYNYGNRLQLFAIMGIYKMLGYQACSLQLCSLCSPSIIRNGVKRALGKQITVTPETLSSEQRLEAFSRFDALIESRSYNRINEIDCREYDYFSVGSDQVWNMSYITFGNTPPISRFLHAIVDRRRIKVMLDWYFLRFAHDEQRIALAPSIGLDDLDSWQYRLMKKGIQGFSHLSVREKRGAEILKQYFGRDATVLIDPTLMLEVEDWRAVEDGRCTPVTPYVFTYLLGGIGVEAASVLDRVTNHGKIPIISLTDRQKSGEPNAGPAEFISLVDHAAHVVTDSFHASVFSMLFETPLTIMHREGNELSIFSRLETLADTFGLWKNVYNSDEFDLSLAGDYASVESPLRQERAKCMSYLRECLAVLPA